MSFTEQLQNVLEERCRRNPRYSLRSFAKSMNVSAASLSGILSGKRKPSPEMVEKVSVALGLALTETRAKYAQLEQDSFYLIAEWYHLAVLEVMKLQDFKPDTSWVAKRLGVNVNQIKLAIERLQRMGILEIKARGEWLDKTGGYTTHYQKDKTTEARKAYQLQLLEKSKEALIQDDYSARDHSSMTMAINPRDLLKAKEEIAEFRKKLSQSLESSPNKKEVYQLQIGFFSLTRKDKSQS